MSDLIIQPPINYERVLRNMNQGGVITGAGVSSGPTVISELWSADADTTNRWTVALGATGLWTWTNVNGLLVKKMNAQANGDTINVLSKAYVSSMPGHAPGSTTHIYQQLVMEWVMRTGTFANINNSTTFFGLASGSSPLRSSNNILGFIFTSDVWNTIGDVAGTESLSTVLAANRPAVDTFAKFKIIAKSASVEFWINDLLATTHTGNIAILGSLQAGFYLEADAGGAVAVDLGPIRLYYSE